MKVLAALLLALVLVAGGHAWNCSSTTMTYAKQIDAGQGKVVMTDRYSRVHFLSGSSWYRLGSLGMTHVTVGPAGLWARDRSSRVYKYIAGNFKLASGTSMAQVDAGGDGQLVGATSTSYGYCLRESSTLAFAGTGSLGWSSNGRRLKYYSCGPLYGCWGVDTNNNVYMTTTVTATTCGHGRWYYVSGVRLTMVEVGTDGSVFGVTTTGKVYQRTGISSSRRLGLRWVEVPSCMTIQHVSYDLRQLWMVTTSGLVMRCSH